MSERQAFQADASSNAIEVASYRDQGYPSGNSIRVTHVMIFVPLTLFATICLIGVLIQMIRTQEMRVRSNQLFVVLVALYALQSFLLSLRWGYDLAGLRVWIGVVAPTLPICAYFAYLSLADRLQPRMMWPLAIIIANWALLLLATDIADIAILATYVSFGIALFYAALWGDDALALVRINQREDARKAMLLTGAALLASGLADMYVIADFIRTGGQNVGFVVTLLQTGFLVVIALAALAGQSATEDDAPAETTEPTHTATPQDDAIIDHLTRLLQVEKLHHDTELNLRRLSRRLGLPDRSVSQAINRTQGMSVSQFVNTFRIKDACALLLETDQSILQVSLAAGFLSKSNFNREFARITGQTPSQWRSTNATRPDQ